MPSDRAGGRRTPKHLPGEVGTWIFILGDMTVFALLFGVYVHAHANASSVFRHSQTILSQDDGAIETLLLVCSSLLVAMGIRALRHSVVPKIAPGMFTGAFCCGLGFCLTKYLEWGDHLRHGFTPATDDFWMYYYVLTGMHLFHLVLGLGVLIFLRKQATKEHLDAHQWAFVEGGACFWHMVDLLWIVLFPLLYLVE